jgi:hypothetical protein
MPEGLWQEAVGLARACGMMPTVRALKIDYGKLKKRVVAAGDAKLAAPNIAVVCAVPHSRRRAACRPGDPR